MGLVLDDPSQPRTHGGKSVLHLVEGESLERFDINADLTTAAAGSVSSVNCGANVLSFAVLNWNGQPYGLAQAISASGARYASLSGPTMSGSGLEWWEHQGQADLNTFVGTDTSDTRPLLTNCKPGR